jgi:hypothetical protein
LKKTIYLVLLAVLILQSGGMLLIFNLQQFHIQYEMAEKLEDSNGPFEKLILTADVYERSRIGDKEICMNGKMYDIKSLTVTGDVVEIFAIQDLEEEDIMKRIKMLVKNTCAPAGKVPPHLQQLMSLVYLPSHAHHRLFLSLTGIYIFHHSGLFTASYDPRIPAPPPKKA